MSGRDTTTGKGAPAAGAKAAGKGGKGGATGKASRSNGEGYTGAGSFEDFGIDRAKFSCELSLTLPLSAPKLLMLEIVERAAAKALVRTTRGIDKCYVLEV